jgi:hypothetical protein
MKRRFELLLVSLASGSAFAPPPGEASYARETSAPKATPINPPVATEGCTPLIAVLHEQNAPPERESRNNGISACQNIGNNHWLRAGARMESFVRASRLGI